METVVLKPLYHHGQERIAIYAAQVKLPSGEPLNYYLQKKASAKWSKTCKCWWIPFTEKNYENFVKL